MMLSKVGYSRKSLPLLVLVGLMPALNAHAIAFPTLSSVERYTATGEDDLSGNPCYSKDIGILSAKNGFIATLSGFDTICASGLEAISGQPVMGLAYWTIYSPSNFKRSSQTYAIDGVSYVIVYRKSGAAYIKKPSVSLSVFEDENGVVWNKTAEGVNPDNYVFGNEQTYPAVFKLTLDERSSQATKVFYTISGSAKNGKDFAKVKGYVIIPAGDDYGVVIIGATDDLKKENTETVKLKLKASKKFYTIGTPGAVSVEILDND